MSQPSPWPQDPEIAHPQPESAAGPENKMPSLSRVPTSQQIQAAMLGAIPDLLILVKKDGTYTEFLSSGDVALYLKSPLEEKVVTISLGVSCTLPTPSAQSTQLLRQADQALYQAKQSGRNYCCLFSSS